MRPIKDLATGEVIDVAQRQSKPRAMDALEMQIVGYFERWAAAGVRYSPRPEDVPTKARAWAEALRFAGITRERAIDMEMAAQSYAAKDSDCPSVGEFIAAIRIETHHRHQSEQGEQNLLELQPASTETVEREAAKIHKMLRGNSE